MSVSNLVRRYFYDPLDEERAEKEQAAAAASKAASFLRSDYYPEFKAHLERLRKVSEPRPGQEGQMLYQCGVRDGIDMVLTHLNDLTEKVRETYE